MNKKALVIAVGLSLAGVAMLQFYMRRFEMEATGGAPVEVLIAQQDIKLGSVLTRSMLGIRKLPTAYIEPRHILASELPKVLGARLSDSLRASESILWSDLADVREQRVLSDLVQDGMRAITISATTFDGLLRPGDRVDILFTQHESPDVNVAARTTSETITLLQNMLVLAVRGDLGKASDVKGITGKGYASLTLSVTMEQAELLTVAERRGSLRLVLRNSEDLRIQEAPPAVSYDHVRDPKLRERFINRNAAAAAALDEVADAH